MESARPASIPPAATSPLPWPISGSREARERLSPAALKAFFNAMARWKVRDEEARGLLGGVSNGPFYEMKRNPDRMLDADRLTRISYIIGIFKALGVLHSRSAGRRVGAASEQQSPVRRPDAARVHDPRRSAGDAERAPAARRAPGRIMKGVPLALVRQLRHAPPRALAPLARGRQRPGRDRGRRRASAGDLRTGRRDQRSSAGGSPALPGDWRRGTGARACRTPHVINAAFCHPHPLGAASADPNVERGTRAFALETAQAEVAFHKSVQLAENELDRRRVGHLRRLPRRFQRGVPRSAAGSRRIAPVSIRTATSSRRRSPSGCWTAAPSAWCIRACAIRRHVRGLFPAGAGDERAARGDVSFHLARRRAGADRVPRRYLITPRTRNQLVSSPDHADSAGSLFASPTPCGPFSKTCISAGTPAWRRAR